MLENDWIKSAVSAMIGAVSASAAFVLRQDRRIVKLEEKADGFIRLSRKIEEATVKSVENGERLARVETSVNRVEVTVDRLEDKVNRALIK